MISWLRYFWLGYFSENIAEEGKKRSLVNLFLAVMLSFAFLFSGLIAADILPFKSRYGGADEFRDFLYSAFSQEEMKDLEIKGDLLKSGEEYLVIDGYQNEADAKYNKNGYFLVVDNHDKDAYDDFDYYCEARNGSGVKITYEQYLEKSEEERYSYRFVAEYTPRALIPDEESAARYEEVVAASKDTDVINSYQKLKKDGTEGQKYYNAIYELYVKAYFPDLTEYESGGVLHLREYYLNKYVREAGVKNYMCLFSDVAVGSFVSGGNAFEVYGYYRQVPEGKLVTGDIQEAADDFIYNVYKSSKAMYLNVDFMNFFRFIPYFALLPLVIGLLHFCATSLLKTEKQNKVGMSIRVVSSFVWFSALIAALITFALGFAVEIKTIFPMMLLLYFGTLLIRTAVSVGIRKYRAERAAKAAPAEAAPAPQNVENVFGEELETSPEQINKTVEDTSQGGEEN